MIGEWFVYVSVCVLAITESHTPPVNVIVGVFFCCVPVLLSILVNSIKFFIYYNLCVFFILLKHIKYIINWKYMVV